MAENETNGTAAPGGDAAAAQQTGHLQINAQYIKDLSFENPRAPQSLTQQIQPEVAINVDVKARGLGNDMFEVILTVNATAKTQEEPVFVVELTYGAVATARSENQELTAMLILVETPRLLFPFARQIVADVTRNGGFPPLMINPIDFAELLRRQQEAVIARQGGTMTA
jgi:preprotein translocase subunit SecB